MVVDVVDTLRLPSPKQDLLHSYTAWVSAEVLAQLGRGTGTAVAVGLYSQTLPGGGSFWVSNAFEVIG